MHVKAYSSSHIQITYIQIFRTESWTVRGSSGWIPFGEQGACRSCEPDGLIADKVHSFTSAWENTYNSPLSGQHVDQHAFPCSLPSLKSSFIFLAGGRLLNTPARHFCCSWMCILSNVVTTFNENILCAISQTTKIRNRFTSPIESCRKGELLRRIYFWFASGTDARESRVGQINKHMNSFPDMIDTMRIALGIIVQRPESGDAVGSSLVAPWRLRWKCSPESSGFGVLWSTSVLWHTWDSQAFLLKNLVFMLIFSPTLTKFTMTFFGHGVFN